MQLRRKIAVAGAFSLGSVVIIASIVRLYYINLEIHQAISTENTVGGSSVDPLSKCILNMNTIADNFAIANALI